MLLRALLNLGDRRYPGEAHLPSWHVQPYPNTHHRLGQWKSLYPNLRGTRDPPNCRWYSFIIRNGRIYPRSTQKWSGTTISIPCWITRDPETVTNVRSQVISHATPSWDRFYFYYLSIFAIYDSSFDVFYLCYLWLDSFPFLSPLYFGSIYLPFLSWFIPFTI